MLQERRTAELGFGQEGRLPAIALRPGHPSRWSPHAQAMLDDAVNALPESSLFQTYSPGVETALTRSGGFGCRLQTARLTNGVSPSACVTRG